MKVMDIDIIDGDDIHLGSIDQGPSSCRSTCIRAYSEIFAALVAVSSFQINKTSAKSRLAPDKSLFCTNHAL